MFTPKAMTMQEPEAITQFIHDYGFGLLITADLNTTRLPMLFQDEGEKGVIIGHMAKANPQWRAADQQRVSAVFSGPHAYISPTWYESRPAMEKLLNAVVGFKIVIDNIHAKEKLGQQKSNADQLGVYQGLLNSQSADAVELVRYMDKRGIGNGHCAPTRHSY